MADRRYNDSPLTEAEQKFASDNHKLIYKYLQYRGLNNDEYYDICAIGFCKAVKNYDPERGKFSTIAFLVMDHEVQSYMRMFKQKMRIPKSIVSSYDVEEFSDSTETRLDYIEDPATGRDVIEREAEFMCFVDSLKNKERYIIKMLSLGHTQRDIARVLGCSNQNINQIFTKIKEKYKEFDAA